jgi:hypothetical protein
MSSTRYHTRGYPWVAHALSLLSSMRYGMVSSNSVTNEATQFAGLHISCMRQYIIKCLFIRTQPMRVLIDIGGRYNLRSSELTTAPSLTFPSCILHFPLVAPPDLILNHSTNYSSSQLIPILNQGIKSPKSRE